MITSPPKNLIENPITKIYQNGVLVMGYTSYLSSVDAKGRYLHFDELKHRLPKPLNPALVWSLMKEVRQRQWQNVYYSFVGKRLAPATLFMTPTIQKAISETDRNTTTAALQWMCNKIAEQKHLGKV